MKLKTEKITPDFVILDTDLYMQKAKVKKVKYSFYRFFNCILGVLQVHRVQEKGSR